MSKHPTGPQPRAPGSDSTPDLSAPQLQSAFLDAPYPAMIHADNGRVLHVNRTWTEITGYQLADIPTIEAWTAKAYGQRMQLVQTVIDELYQSDRRTEEGEFTVRCQDGTERIWRFSSSPLGAHTDGSRLVLSMAVDMTEAKQVEEHLRESKSRLHALFDLESIGVAHVEVKSGRIIDINGGYERITGFSRDELLAMKFPEITHPDDRAQDWELFSAAAKGLCPYRNEKRYLCKDGSFIWVRLNVAFVRDSRGQPVTTVAICEDISERKAAEVEQKRLQMAVEQSGEIFLITEPDGTIIYVNPTFEKISGYSREEALGANPRILKSGKQNAEFYRVMWSTLLRGETWRGRMVNRRKNGSLYTTEYVISPVRDERDRTCYYAAVARDITDELQASHLLAQAQRMDSIGRLAGGVAHDFNNMLSVILGRVRLALDDAAPDSPLGESLREIQAAASRSADLTRQLLAFARHQTAVPQVLDLNQTLENMLKMLVRLIGEDIDLVFTPAPDLPSVLMDPSQIDQILANLCVNARDAIGAQGGRITIETGFSQFDQKYYQDQPGVVSGDFVMLAVSDDGCGMDEEALQHLFEPFYTTKDPGAGTGLGLATTYGIVKQNQGFINVYSEPGSGTTFRIYLPAQRGVAPSQTEPTVPAKDTGGQETILVVEDEPAVLTLVSLILAEKGYAVIEAATPAQALKVTRTHPDPIHLLITDVVMPGMNGKELAETLLTDNPELKCIFMSGYTADVIAHHGLLHEGVRFVQKPISVDDLTTIVRSVLDA